MKQQFKLGQLNYATIIFWIVLLISLLTITSLIFGWSFGPIEAIKSMLRLRGRG